MSNSSLVTVTVPSPNKGSRCGKKIDTITIHCTAGNGTAERIGNIFVPKDRNASSNYGVGEDGSVGLYVDESERSWCSSSKANDSRAITIEVSSEPKKPYAVSDAAYNKMIDLVTDICRRNGIEKLIWSPDADTRRSHDQGANMTCHRDFNNTACPGDYLYSRMPEIAKAVNDKIGASGPYIVTGNEAPSIAGEIKDPTKPTDPENMDLCADPSSQGNSIDGEPVTSLPDPEDANFPMAVAKMLIGIDDEEFDKAIEKKGMELLSNLEGAEFLHDLDLDNPASIASIGADKISSIVTSTVNVVENIGTLVPSSLAAVFGLTDFTEIGEKLKNFGTEFNERMTVNKTNASAYTDTKMNPDTALTDETVKEAIGTVRKREAERGTDYDIDEDDLAPKEIPDFEPPEESSKDTQPSGGTSNEQPDTEPKKTPEVV